MRVNCSIKACLVTPEERAVSTWAACIRTVGFCGAQSGLQMWWLPWQFRHGMLIEYHAGTINGLMVTSGCLFAIKKYIYDYFAIGACRGVVYELMHRGN